VQCGVDGGGGDFTNESFAPQKFRDPVVLSFMQKIEVIEDPTYGRATDRLDRP